GAVIVAPEVAATVKVNDQGSTFGGGPLAMRALEATIEVIETERLPERARALGERIRAGLAGIRGVRGVRGMGLLLGIELEAKAADVRRRSSREGSSPERAACRACCGSCRRSSSA